KAKVVPPLAPSAPAPEPAAKTSIWKKEIGLGRKREEQGVPVPERASPPERDDSVAEPLPPLAVPPLSRAVHQAGQRHAPAPPPSPSTGRRSTGPGRRPGTRPGPCPGRPAPPDRAPPSPIPPPPRPAPPPPAPCPPPGPAPPPNPPPRPPPRPRRPPPTSP